MNRLNKVKPVVFVLGRLSLFPKSPLFRLFADPRRTQTSANSSTIELVPSDSKLAQTGKGPR